MFSLVDVFLFVGVSALTLVVAAFFVFSFPCRSFSGLLIVSVRFGLFLNIRLSLLEL